MDYGIPIAFIALVVIALVTLRSIKTYHHAESAERIPAHLPRADYRLLGEDYRDKVAGYFNGRLESDRRVALAVHHQVFPETTKTGGDASTSRPVNTRSSDPRVRNK